MPAPRYLPRLAEPRLREALADSPVVLIHGPRQCGKTTLALRIGGRRKYQYFSFDDDVVRAAAESDPAGFVAALPPRTIMDEIQRVPHLFTALKTAVDRDRRPGRFLLTGSANVLLLPRLSDSLAGRIQILRLLPLAQCEIERKKPSFLERLFRANFPIRNAPRLGPKLADRMVAGGFPAALARRTARRRAAWHGDYVETLVQRDARDLARIASLDVLPRLLHLAAGRTAQLLNVSDLSSPFQLSRPTIRDYLTLLERLYLLDELPPWHVNRTSRLVKARKLHLGDAGVAASLLGYDADALRADRTMLGQLLETFVLQDLRRQATGMDADLRFHHFRDRDGYEVDVVIERGARQVAGVEVKAGATVTVGDFQGMRRLASAAGERFVAGVVLYDGETSVGFGEGMFAVPLRALWEGGTP